MAEPGPQDVSARSEQTIAHEPTHTPLADEMNEAAVRAQTGELSVAELASLVRANQRKRWQQGDRPPAEAFLEEFPTLKADDMAVLDLIMDEFQLREQQGEKPDIEEYARRFPDLAVKLRRQFQLHRMLDTSFSMRSPALKECGDTDSFGPQRAAKPVLDVGRPSVDGYEILDELGRGGMGVVYKARQLRLGRLVALKMILAGGHAGADDLFRFRTEAEAVAQLQHPNIVQIYEVGEQDGRPYFSLEYVEGGSLADKLDDGKLLRPDEAAQMVEMLARAVQAAHEKGIIHRDLKPANVLLTLDGNPKVTDFGLAKQLGSDKGQTRSGSVMGTPSYMAPEQAAGATREVGTLSDIYALGAILYELLTGRPPFLAESPLDTLLQVVNEEPVPPRRLQSKVPADLETICMKCLEKNSRRRYPSAQSLADDLRRYLNHEPIHARPTGFVERVLKWTWRHPAYAALIVVCALSALGLVAGGSYYHLRLQTALAEAEQAKKDAEYKVVRLNVVNGMQLADNGDLLAALPWLTRALEMVEKADDDDPVRRELYRIRVGSILRQCPRIIQMWFHDGRVTVARYSPDGKRVVTASADKTTRVWDAATGEPITPSLWHNDIVRDANFSPDGKRVVTASADKTARVWDVATGKPVTDPLPHDRCVVHAEFSPDGKRVLTASQDNTAAVWDAATGKRMFSMRHEGPLRWATYSPDGQRIVTGGDDDMGRIWDANHGSPVGKPLQHQEDVLHAEFSPDNSRVVTASADGTGRVWDAATGEPISPPLKHHGPVQWATFSPRDGRLVATASDDNTAQLWDAKTGALASMPMRHTSAIYTVQFSHDGKSLVTASDDNNARLWRTDTGEPLSMPLKHNGPVATAALRSSLPLKHNGSLYGAAIKPDGSEILTASADGTARVWRTATKEVLGDPLINRGRLTSGTFSPDGRQVLITSRSGSARLWDAETDKPLEPTMWHRAGKAVFHGEFNRDGTRIVTASADHTARVWDAATRKPVTPPLQHDAEVRFASFNPNGTKVVTASADGTAHVWDAASGKPLTAPLKHAGPVNQALFSPDGTKVVTASADHTAQVWDAATGKPLTPPLRHAEEIFTAEFSPDGKKVVTASADRTAQVWDAATSKPLLKKPIRHSSMIYQAIFSPDGRRVATAGDDNNARIWDAATGEPITPLMSHGGRLYRVRFGPQGRRLATASEDNTARVWDARTGAPLTPPLPHAAGVTDIAFSPHRGKVVTVSNDRTGRIWRLQPDDRPLEELVLLSKFLAGGWLDPITGGFMPLDPKQMRDTFKEVRARQRQGKLVP